MTYYAENRVRQNGDVKLELWAFETVARLEHFLATRSDNEVATEVSTLDAHKTHPRDFLFYPNWTQIGNSEILLTDRLL